MYQNSNSQVLTTYSKLVVDLFCAVDSSGWESLAEIFHSNIIYERPGYSPFVGIERILQFYQMERVIASGKHHIEHITIDGSYGACWGRFVGISKDSSQIDELFADVYSFEKGKIKTRKTHFFRPAV
ncbi:MAG: nuclear transport factor 2 family protein [Nostoc sp.]|uniref:nuclear transport factor 2 family protein n=1 Tax=Nostoc sp. TaxID=1180 RepID=UPI002FF5B9E4